MAGAITAALFLRRFVTASAALRPSRHLRLDPAGQAGAGRRAAPSRRRGRSSPLLEERFCRHLTAFAARLLAGPPRPRGRAPARPGGGRRASPPGSRARVTAPLLDLTAVADRGAGLATQLLLRRGLHRLRDAATTASPGARRRSTAMSATSRAEGLGPPRPAPGGGSRRSGRSVYARPQVGRAPTPSCRSSPRCAVAGTTGGFARLRGGGFVPRAASRAGGRRLRRRRPRASSACPISGAGAAPAASTARRWSSSRCSPPGGAAPRDSDMQAALLGAALAAGRAAAPRRSGVLERAMSGSCATPRRCSTPTRTTWRSRSSRWRAVDRPGCAAGGGGAGAACAAGLTAQCWQIARRPGRASGRGRAPRRRRSRPSATSARTISAAISTASSRAPSAASATKRANTHSSPPAQGQRARGRAAAAARAGAGREQLAEAARSRSPAVAVAPGDLLAAELGPPGAGAPQPQAADHPALERRQLASRATGAAPGWRGGRSFGQDQLALAGDAQHVALPSSTISASCRPAVSRRASWRGRGSGSRSRARRCGAGSRTSSRCVAVLARPGN